MCHFILLQLPFIKNSKPVEVLSQMLNDAARIREEEAQRCALANDDEEDEEEEEDGVDGEVACTLQMQHPS